MCYNPPQLHGRLLCTSSIYAAIRLPNPPPPCAAQWPRRRWVTTFWATTPPSSGWKSCPPHGLGKEAGLFVASGTMGNLVSLLAHCGRGDEVILGDLAHTFINEQGGMAAPRRHPAAHGPQSARRHAGPRRRRGGHPRQQHPLSPHASSRSRTPTTCAAARRFTPEHGRAGQAGAHGLPVHVDGAHLQCGHRAGRRCKRLARMPTR